MTESSKAVFLSYASQDAEAAARICAALRAAGVEVWFDQSSLRGGDAWDGLIRRQVRECAVFMPVISANADTRTEGYFRLEWRLAVDRSHLMSDDRLFLLPVVIDDTPEPTRMLARVRRMGHAGGYRQRAFVRSAGDSVFSRADFRRHGGASEDPVDRGAAASEHQPRRRRRALC